MCLEVGGGMKSDPGVFGMYPNWSHCPLFTAPCSADTV